MREQGVEILRTEADLPLDAGPGVDRDLPEPLRRTIFGEDKRIHAVLAGGRIPHLVERLEAMDLPRTCLFGGELAETAAEFAPWLVELAPDAPLLRQMLCHVSGDVGSVQGFMSLGAGMLIRSDVETMALRAHLRRFMRVLDARGRPFFFRLWEPESAAAYFAGLTDRPATMARWMRPRDGGAVDAILLPVWDGGPALVTARAGPGVRHAVPETGAFALTLADVATLAEVQWRHDLRGIADRLTETFPDVAVRVGRDLPDLVANVAARMSRAGFARRDMLFTVCAWALHYGADFVERDPTGDLARQLTAPGTAEDRFAAVSARMDELERGYFARPSSLS